MRLDTSRLTLEEIRLHPGTSAFPESYGYEFASYWSDPQGLEARTRVFQVVEREGGVADGVEGQGGQEANSGQRGPDIARISVDRVADGCMEIALIDVREEQRGQGIAHWMVGEAVKLFDTDQLIATPEDELTEFWEHMGWRREEDLHELHGFKMLPPRE